MRHLRFAGSMSLAGAVAPWTASAALLSSSLSLEVSQAVTDLAGNVLAYPFIQVFSPGSESSFFSGMVIVLVTAVGDGPDDADPARRRGRQSLALRRRGRAGQRPGPGGRHGDERRGRPASVQPNVSIRLLGLDDSVDQVISSDGNGSFSLTQAATAGNRYLLAIGARLSSKQPLEIRFNEALAGPLSSHFEVLDASSLSLPVEITPIGTPRAVRIVPASGWPSPATFTLRLNPGLADLSGNAWLEELNLAFDVVGGSVTGSLSTNAARDVARLGSLLFVAADSQGVVVVDASDPQGLKNYLPNDLAFPLPLADPVRGLTVDAHGRVVFVGGGITGFGQLKILDPLAIDRAAILANPQDQSLRLAAYRGSTLLSDQLGGIDTQLPQGLPRRVAVLSDDESATWRVGVDPEPSAITPNPAFPPSETDPYDLTLTGTATPNQPVTLRNLTRGSWHRVDADGSGNFSLTHGVHSGDELRLLRSRHSVAYVTLDDFGLMIVDLNQVYGQDFQLPSQQGEVVGAFTMQDLPLGEIPACPSGPLNTFNPIDVKVLIGSGSWSVPTLAGGYGLLMLEVDPNLLKENAINPASLHFVSAHCGEVEGSSQMGGMEVVQGYPLEAGGSDLRDYVLVTNSAGWLLVYDATDPHSVVKVDQVALPGLAKGVVVDRSSRRVYVTGSSEVYVVSFDEPGAGPVDVDGDGVDDRVLETIAVPAGTLASSVLLAPELGLGYVGGLQSGLSRVTMGSPDLALVTEVGGSWQRYDRLAPYGVPSGPEDLPGQVRVRMVLPGSLGDSVQLDLVSLGPGGVEIDGAGEPSQITNLPPTSLSGTSGLVLERQSSSIYDEGYSVYISKPVVLLADLKSSVHYSKTAAELDAKECRRCDLVAEGVYTAAEVAAGNVYRELLSGEYLGLRIPSPLRTNLGTIYTKFLLDAAESQEQSVRWEMDPSLRQEPTLNPSYGSGDAAPGTLLHSGEMTQSATDVSIRGRGFDFTFTRTFRNQTVGNGPLGPGWDHSLRVRLRALPDGAVEYYDGRGRREIFETLGNDKYQAPPGRFVTLEKISSGWVLVDSRHNVIRFDSFGRLVSIADAVKVSETTGNSMELLYDSHSRLERVRDTLDRDIYFEYDAKGHLEKLSDFSGRVFEYGYDTEGRLKDFKTPAVKTFESPVTPEQLVTTYGYDPMAGNVSQKLNGRDNLRTLKDPKGQTWLSVIYEDKDGDGRAEEIAHQEWGGYTLHLTYDFAARTAQVTDRRSKVWSYEMNATGQTKRLTDPVPAEWLWSHNAEGLVAEETMPMGRKTIYTYDEHAGRRSQGNLLEIRVTPDSRGPNGSSNELVSTIDYESDTNQPERIVDPRGTVTTIKRRKTGLVDWIREAEGEIEERTTSFDYNDFGQPFEITNPNGHVSRSTYFTSGTSRGYLETVTVDPSGLALTKTYETDGRGNVKAVINPRGVRNEQDFNELDWPVESRQAVTGSNDGATALSYTTQYDYNRNGKVAEARIPFADGSESTKVQYTYGLLNEILFEKREILPGDPEAEWVVKQYDYDENLNRIRLTEPEGDIREWDYNDVNLIEVARSGLGPKALPDPIEQRSFYDPDRNLILQIDGRTHDWDTGYDGYGRLMTTEDPLLNRSERTYDNNGNMTSQTAYDSSSIRLAETEFIYDRLNRRTEQKQWLWTESLTDQRPVGARELSTWYSFDKTSNLVQVENALHRPTHYRYDAAERLYETEDAAGNLQHMILDDAGNVKEVQSLEIDPTSTTTVVTTKASYDALNRQVEVEDAFPNVTRTTYDARNQTASVTDAEEKTATYSYDGLNRRTKMSRPEGIDVTYIYDKSSRLKTYVDALTNPTTWTYDALGRKATVTFADTKVQTFQYDSSSNVTEFVDQRGTTVVPIYDDANRMTGRTATPKAGETLAGPLLESFGYDGLNRLTHGESGTVVTDLVYDSLSRTTSETTLGRTVSYAYDDVGNRTRVGYPSGIEIGQQFDLLNRPELIGPVVDDTILRSAEYSYRGPSLLYDKKFGNGLLQTFQYDIARRPVQIRTSNGADDVFAEGISWSPRNLKVATFRGDMLGSGLVLEHDAAGRLLHAAKRTEGLFPVINNTTPSVAVPSSEEPGKYSFTYDGAQNLTAETFLSRGVDDSTTLPSDDSGRNRPGSIVTDDGTISLAYDDNGNLVQKGPRSYFYDYRNRLTSVTDGGIEVARYDYDIFNRRVRVQRPAVGEIAETVWSGWREIEEYTQSQLYKRNTFGLGLDEVVRIEADEDMSGSFDVEVVPHYDHTGNVTVLTGLNDEIVMRYDYSPFSRGIKSTQDDVPPEVTQVTVDDDQITVEMSEEVKCGDGIEVYGEDPSPLHSPGAIAQKSVLIPVNLEQPVQQGRWARRRLVITPSSPPSPGEQVQLVIQPGGVKDTFLNPLAAAYSVTFAWPDPSASRTIIEDTASPEVDEVRLHEGDLVIAFSEPLDMSLVSAAIQVGGQALAWEQSDDGYEVRTAIQPSDGTHTLTIAAGVPLDRSGQGLASTFSRIITVTSEQPSMIFYEAADPREVPFGSFMNQLAFHGRPLDDETGLMYLRNRYYDPDLGRFITPDPFGFADGPSMYQFAGYSPLTLSDPYGLYIRLRLQEFELIRTILAKAGYTELAESLSIEFYKRFSKPHNHVVRSNWGVLAIDEEMQDKWKSAASLDELVEVFRDLIENDTKTTIRVVGDDVWCTFLGFIDSDLEPHCSKPGADLVHNMGGVTKKTVLDEFEVYVNEYIVNNMRVWGEDRGRIDMPLDVALVHELGHVYWSIKKAALIPRSNVGHSGPGPTHEDAAWVEDLYRKRIGLPLRGSHSAGTFCSSGLENRPECTDDMYRHFDEMDWL